MKKILENLFDSKIKQLNKVIYKKKIAFLQFKTRFFI